MNDSTSRLGVPLLPHLGSDTGAFNEANVCSIVGRPLAKEVPVPGVWGQLATAEDAATLASGLANASYFAHRARHATGARRLAAGVLVSMTAGSAALALLLLLPGTLSVAVDAALRLPLLAGNLGAFALIALGHRR